MKVIGLIFLVLCLGVPVHAEIDITINELGIVSQYADVYYPNGTLVESFQTNSTVLTLHDNQSYQITLRPTRVNYLKNPGQLLNLLYEYSELLITIFFLALFAKIIFGR